MRAWIIGLAESERVGIQAIREPRRSPARRPEITSTRIRARVPLPALHGVVNSDRDGLGAARDVAGDHDGDAEIAQGSGEGEHGGGEDGAAGQRQRDPPEQPPLGGAEGAGGALVAMVDGFEGGPRGLDQQRQRSGSMAATTAACQVNTSGEPKIHSYTWPSGLVRPSSTSR